VTVGADGWPVVDAVQSKGPRWRRAG
jgi:hypothetical protein